MTECPNLLKSKLVALLEEKRQRKKYNFVETLYPETGPLSRDKYPKHMEFFRATKDHMFTAFIAANQIGKTLNGALFCYYHASGKYPDWWEGKRFTHPVKIWIASVTPQQMRESVQDKLFGPFIDKGTGVIPREDLLGEDGNIMTWNMAGAPNVIGTAFVKHVSGGYSQLEFKTYEQGRAKFQGGTVHVAWFDEEPSDYSIYSETVMRIVRNKGVMINTFTPLSGYSDVVLNFLPGGKVPEGGEHPETKQRYVVCAGWDDVPHLDEESKKAALAEFLPHERDARSKGIPSKGSGAIYPVPEEFVVLSRPPIIEPFYKKAFGMDFGWTNPTAVVWGAQDPSTKIIYIYSEHYLSRQTAPVHAQAIKSRGKWIQGVTDPSGWASQGPRGVSFAQEYLDLDLQIRKARGGPGDKEGRIAKVLSMLEAGLIRFSPTCTNLLAEFRLYRRDENGNIIKKDDHLMDALAYLIYDFDLIADLEPDPDAEQELEYYSNSYSGRDEVTGY